MTTFVGRARELFALAAAVDSGARLVTVTGAGGIGKTRLVREWASTRLGETRVVFADLSEARSLDDACVALGKSLGVPLAPGGTDDDLVVQLGRVLAGLGPCVVSLDNLEQLAALGPRMLGPWLSLAPEARLVVTSRERLRLEGEVVLELEPLAVPPEEERALSSIAASPAVELFVSRAKARRLDFELGEADAVAVAAIVRRVDGIPLAIELCAARVGVLAPPQILARLARRFELLVSGTRGAPARQATLRGAIDSSWELLAPAEKAALARCSVFRGGFSLAAAEAVLDSASALDLLEALHDRSLLRAFDAPGMAGERRYGLLESLREYAAERLGELDDSAGAFQRHTDFFLGLSKASDARRLALETENLTAVCERALERGDSDAALRGLSLLEPVLLFCAKGRLEPFVAMLDAALERPGATIDPVVRARALYTRAMADLLRGRVLDGLGGFHRALEGTRAAGSREGESLALTKLAIMLELADHPDEARAHFDAARVIALELGDPALRADWMLSFGGTLIWRGRSAEAALHVEEAASGFRVAGDRRGESLALAQLAQARLSLGRFDDAERATGEALALLEATEDRRTEGYVLGVVGRLHQARGRFGEAREKLMASLAIHRAVGDRWFEGVLRAFLGDLAFEEGRLEDALLEYGGAQALLHRTGERHYAAVSLAATGAVELALARTEAGADHLASAVALLASARSLTTRVAVDLHGGHLDLARSFQAQSAGKAEEAARLRDEATARIRRAEAPGPDGALPAARSSEDVRFAVRLLERALRAVTPPRGPLPDALEAGRAVLIVGPEARWFRLRGEPPVNLLKSRAARLVLARLSRRRVDAPGHALSLEQLFEAGWPGERIPLKAKANRVYVTLTKLRRLGIGSLLQSRDDGFLLDPTAVVLEALE